MDLTIKNLLCRYYALILENTRKEDLMKIHQRRLNAVMLQKRFYFHLRDLTNPRYTDYNAHLSFFCVDLL